jgi:hypothetical protein
MAFTNNVPTVPASQAGQVRPYQAQGTNTNNSAYGSGFNQNFYNPAGQFTGLFGMGGNLGSLGGSLGGALGGLFGDYKNPGAEQMKYLNQLAGTITPYYQPFINFGLDAGNQLMPQFQNLINDPSSVMNKIGKSFQSSPGFQFQVDQASRAANNTAAAGGMLGTPQNQQFVADTTQNLAARDYDNYMTKALGLFGQGLTGLGNMFNTGYQASDALSGNLSQALIAQANAAAAAAQAQNQQENSKWSGIGGLASGIMSLF